MKLKFRAEKKDIVAFIVNVLTYDITIRSALALDELYGDDGSIWYSSSHSSSG